MTHLKSRIAPLLLLLAFSPPAPALQVLEARNGETLVAKISQKEITRIAVDDGQIRKVTGNAGEFNLEKDGERGQVFIRPAQPDSTKPINVFVSTDRTTVALILQPVDGPSDTILIRERTVLTPSAPRNARGSTHVRRIKGLLLAMARDARSADVEVRDTLRELALWPGTSLTQDKTYVSGNIVGERYQLANLAGNDLDIGERDLHKPGVMAISITQRLLRPGEVATIYVIRERGHHD